MLVVFCPVGGFVLYTGFKNRRLAKESELWPTTGGKVLTAEVSKRTSRDRKRKTISTYYAPNVRYSYMVAGQSYESTVIRFGSLESASSKKAEEVIARYPAGTTVVVRHHPADPSRATLETQSAAGQQILVGIVFITALIIILHDHLAWRSLPWVVANPIWRRSACAARRRTSLEGAGSKTNAARMSG